MDSGGDGFAEGDHSAATRSYSLGVVVLEMGRSLVQEPSHYQIDSSGGGTKASVSKLSRKLGDSLLPQAICVLLSLCPFVYRNRFQQIKLQM
jgi:hypothetical protein